MPLPASTGCWHPWLVAIPLPSLVLGLGPYPSRLCLHLHKASSGVFEASPLLLSTFVLEFRTHPNPEGFHLKILNCLHPQNPYFQLRSHSEVVGGPEFGGVAIQPLQPSSRKASCVLSLPMLITPTLIVREQNSSGRLAGGEGAGAHSWSTGSRDLLSWPHVSLHPAQALIHTHQAHGAPSPQQGSGGSWPVLICSSAEAERSMDPTTGGSHIEVLARSCDCWVSLSLQSLLFTSGVRGRVEEHGERPPRALLA